MVQDATEAFKAAFEPGEAASMSVSAGLAKIKNLNASAPPPAPEPAPAPAAPVQEPDLGPGGAEFITAMLMGGPDAVRELEQQQAASQPPLPGFGNIPSMQAPAGLPNRIEFGPLDPPEKRPVGRPRSNSATNAPRAPPPVKIEATDAQLSKRVLLEAKIKAYMRLRPALKEMVRVPVPNSPIEDFEWCLGECRQCLSWGVEEKALKMALGAGVGVLEQSLPYLREWVPETQAHHLNGEGISEDLRRTLDERNTEQDAVDFRECLALCAVDLMGWVSFSPWLMLGFSMLAMFNRRVQDNNQAMLEDARNRTMQRGVSLSGVQTSDL